MVLPLRMVLPLSLAGDEEPALAQLERLQLQRATEAHLVHIGPAHALRGLMPYAERLSKAGLRVTQTVVAPSALPLAAHIHQLAEQVDAHAILAVNKRRTGLARVKEGTALPGLVRQAQAARPVWIMNGPRPVLVRRLLLATDFSPAAQEVCLHLARLASTLGAGITLAMVNTRRQFETERDFRAHCRAVAQFILTQQPELIKTITEYQLYNAEELPQGIIQCAEDGLADAIVLATQGRKGLNLLMNGSVTHAVLSASPLPVLVYRIPQAE